MDSCVRAAVAVQVNHFLYQHLPLQGRCAALAAGAAKSGLESVGTAAGGTRGDVNRITVTRRISVLYSQSLDGTGRTEIPESVAKGATRLLKSAGMRCRIVGCRETRLPRVGVTVAGALPTEQTATGDSEAERWFAESRSA